MKDNEIKVEIDITAQLHHALAEVAKYAMNESGIKITSANFDWIDMYSSTNTQACILSTVSVNTEIVPK